MQVTDELLTPAPQLNLQKALRDHPDVWSLEDRCIQRDLLTLSESEYVLVVEFVEKYCTLLRELNAALDQLSTITSGQR